MKIWKIILGAIAAIIALPVAFAVVAIVTISIFDQANGRIVSSGVEREYLLYVPESYNAAKPTALVMSLHAGATWPAHQMNLTRWNRLADAHGFIVVYPSGTPDVLNVVRTWRTWEAGPDLEEDVRFVDELIDSLQTQYNIDPTRIYADGISNGGGMAFVLSCALSQRIAAVRVVAPAQTLPTSWCTPARPVPMIAFHGDADRILPYEGGQIVSIS